MTETGAETNRLARNAVPLADPGAVIVATDGYIDVFAVASGETGASGALHHVLRAAELQDQKSVV